MLLHNERPWVPVIVLTARGGIDDRLKGLRGGAVDYVVKPFVLAELEARIQSQLRVGRQLVGTTMRYGDLSIDLLTRKVMYDERAIRLSTTEFELLAQFVQNVGTLLTRPQLQRAVWGYRHELATNVVDVYVGYLRRKVVGPDGPLLNITAVRSRGYRLEPAGLIARIGLRWRLVGWVTAAMLCVLAVVFVVVYQQTGSQLRSQVTEDVRGDVGALSQTLRTLRPQGSGEIVDRLRRYIDSQPYSDASALLFAVVPGHATISNHPELFGSDRPDDGESATEQQRENREGRALLLGPTGPRTAQAPDVGAIRLDERMLTIAGTRLRVGAGESLLTVTRAQRSVARSFLLAGALALALVLIASYLAGGLATRPIRRLATPRRANRRRRTASPDARLTQRRARDPDPRRVLQPHARTARCGVLAPTRLRRRRVARIADTR